MFKIKDHEALIALDGYSISVRVLIYKYRIL